MDAYLTRFFISGQVADLVLACMAIEALLLTWHCRRTGRQDALPALLCNLAAGAFLALALRAALIGGSWPWIAGNLTGALLAHVLGLVQSLSRSR